MKLNKNLIAIGLIIALSALIISFLLLINNPNNDTINYWSNVFLAVFGSSVVMIFTSVWGYFSERKKYELQYATFARDFLLRASRFLNTYNNINASPKEVYNITGALHPIYDTFAYERNFDIYGYFLNHGKRRKRMKYIQDTIDVYAREISRIEFLSQESFHDHKTEFKFQSSITVNNLNSIFETIQELFCS